ncbi:hypothetical protein CHARACLAT_030970 [Characodon lateralis]|uniref:Uncharacterized protein n=1 Tax=Characodon lateralis TaxID=208331 RepID=A0ABU7DZ42_9TELE|nr:hypothetical protein [Characodon lateralis]
MEKQLHLNLLASRPPMAGGFQSGGSKMKMGPGRKRDFTPLLWSQYFETIEDVEFLDLPEHFQTLLQRLQWSCAVAASRRGPLCAVLGRVYCCHMQQNQLQGGGHGPSSSCHGPFCFYMIAFNQIRRC